jgi:hypothetical protein
VRDGDVAAQVDKERHAAAQDADEQEVIAFNRPLICAPSSFTRF